MASSANSAPDAAAVQLPPGTHSEQMDGLNIAAPLAQAAQPRSSANKITSDRGCMIDGIAVPPHMLQALRRMHQSRTTAIIPSGSNMPASAALSVAELSNQPPRIVPSAVAEATMAQTVREDSASVVAQQSGNSIRCLKRRRVPNNLPATRGADSFVDSSLNRLEVGEDDTSLSGSNEGSSVDSDLEDNNAQMEQLIALRQTVDELTNLARDNSSRIDGFNQNIQDLIHSKEALSVRVNTLQLQLQQQQDEISSLQYHIRQMHLVVTEDVESLQRTSSSSSHFDL